MQAYFINDIDVVLDPVATAAPVVPTQAANAPRTAGRRAMMFSAVAGLGILGLGAGVFAAVDTTPKASPAAPPAAPKVAIAHPGPALTTPSAEDRKEWALFKAQSMTSDGRIVDDSNKGESHSEGQGVGMLFAVAFDDHAAFEQLHTWTKRNLLRSDGLHAWRYLPNAANPVSDPNNATDGDIYIAAALQRAARRWNRPDYAVTAAVTARAIHDKLLVRTGHQLVLLPAANGFDHSDRVVLNLSYYIFPLLIELDGAYPSEDWAQLRRDGVALIQKASFGRWKLPSDWIDVSKGNGEVTLASTFPPRFSWDAVRVPLFLAWAGEGREVLQSIGVFWDQNGDHPPAWIDLKSGEVAEYAICPGVRSISTIADDAVSSDANTGKLSDVAKDVYYSAALTLLSRMARAEMDALPSV